MTTLTLIERPSTLAFLDLSHIKSYPQEKLSHNQGVAGIQAIERTFTEKGLMGIYLSTRNDIIAEKGAPENQIDFLNVSHMAVQKMVNKDSVVSHDANEAITKAIPSSVTREQFMTVGFAEPDMLTKVKYYYERKFADNRKALVNGPKKAMDWVNHSFRALKKD